MTTPGASCATFQSAMPIGDDAKCITSTSCDLLVCLRSHISSFVSSLGLHPSIERAACSLVSSRAMDPTSRQRGALPSTITSEVSMVSARAVEATLAVWFPPRSIAASNIGRLSFRPQLTPLPSGPLP